VAKLYLIDGMSHIYRAYYAIKWLTNRDGLSTNAIYGFTVMLRKLIEDEKPDYLGVAIDLSGPTVRHEKYEDYKAALQCSRNLRRIQETLKERVGRDSGSFAIRIRDEEPEIIKIALQKEKERIDSRQKAREKMDSEDWADRMDEYYMNRAFAPEREGSVDISPPPRYGVNEKDAPRLLNVLNKAIKALKDDGMELEFEKGSFGIKRINTRPHRVNPITSVVAINISIGDLKEIGKPVEYTGKELKFKN